MDISFLCDPQCLVSGFRELNFLVLEVVGLLFPFPFPFPFFFSSFLWVNIEIILTEFVLNWSHMSGVSFQRIEIRQVAFYDPRGTVPQRCKHLASTFQIPQFK